MPGVKVVPDGANTRYLVKDEDVATVVITAEVAEVAFPDSAPLNVPQVMTPLPPDDPTVSEGTDGLTMN